MRSILITGLLLLLIFGCKKEEPNTPPVALFTISPDNGDTDTEFIFDASGCSDKEDLSEDLQIRWDWEDDGEWDTEFSVEKTINHQFSKAGNFTVSLEVKDRDGLTTITSKNIEVSNDIGKNPDGYFTDPRDSIEYGYINIGDQIWMAENLAYLPAVDNILTWSQIEPHYYVYEYDGTNVEEAKAWHRYVEFGVLYNWEAARISCPENWHLPTDDEWKTLEIYLGMTAYDANNWGWRYSGDVANKIKSKTGWNYDRNGSNSSGFNAFPSGRWNPQGGSCCHGNSTLFWTSSQTPNHDAISRFFYLSFEAIDRHYSQRLYGFSVRCIKDEVRPEHQQ